MNAKSRRFNDLPKELPKHSVFSPTVQSSAGSSSLPRCCDPASGVCSGPGSAGSVCGGCYSTKSTSVVQYFDEPQNPQQQHGSVCTPDLQHRQMLQHPHQLQHQPQNYVPTQGGVHDSHYCDHTYATIPAEYCQYYQQQQHQHPNQLQQHQQLQQQLYGSATHLQQLQQHQQQLQHPHSPYSARYAAHLAAAAQAHNNQQQQQQHMPPPPQYQPSLAQLPPFPPPPAPDGYMGPAAQATLNHYPTYYPGQHQQRCMHEVSVWE